MGRKAVARLAARPALRASVGGVLPLALPTGYCGYCCDECPMETPMQFYIF